MRTHRSPLAVRRAALPFLVLAVALAACGDDDGPTTSEESPIAGFARVGQGDSSTASPTSTPTAGPEETPGFFRGTVYGYVPGPDSIATATPLAGVRVTAYVGVPTPAGVTGPGDEVAATVTDALGEWRLPEVPYGAYVIAFAPADGMPYRGAWTVARAWSGSGAGRWVVYLGPR